MAELTREQVNQLDSWFAQRDAVLRDIAEKNTESEKLTKNNNDLSASNTDLETRINSNKGRVEILEKQEQEKEFLLSQKIAKLIVQETELSTKVSGLQTEVNALVGRKGDLESMIATLESLHDKIFDKVGVLGQVVDHVKRVGVENTDTTRYLIAELKDATSGLLNNFSILNTEMKHRMNDLTLKRNDNIDEKGDDSVSLKRKDDVI